MKFLENLFKKKKNYIIHEIGGGDDDAYITFIMGDVTYMVILEWEDSSDTIDITFGVEDEYAFDTTNINKPYSVVNNVYDIVDDVMKYLKKKHKYKFTKVSFSSSNYRNGVIEQRSKDLRDNFFLRRIRRDYPNSSIEEGSENYLFINLNN